MATMTKQDKLLTYLTEHPDAANSELSAALETDDTCIRTMLHRAKNRGWIEVANDGDEGKRRIIVLREPKKTYDYKKAILQDMCEAYYDDFMKAELYSERVEIGKMICRILEKI